MGFFSNLFGGGGGDAGSSKPKKRFDVNTGNYLLQVKGTNDSQKILKRINTGSGMTFCVTELTEDQLADGYPPMNCLNVNAGKNVKVNTPETWLGYIDPDHGKVKYLKKLVAEYQIVNVHGYIDTHKEKARMSIKIAQDVKGNADPESFAAGSAR